MKINKQNNTLHLNVDILKIPPSTFKMKILSKLADCHNRPKDAASSWKVSSTHKVNIKNIEF